MKIKRELNREHLSRKDLAKDASPLDRKLPTGQIQSRKGEAKEPETRLVLARGTPDKLKIIKLKIIKSGVICSPSKRMTQIPSRKLPPKTKTNKRKVDKPLSEPEPPIFYQSTMTNCKVQPGNC